MALPVEHETFQQVGPAQEGRVHRRRAPQHDMIATARAGVASVGEIFVCAQPCLPRFFIERDSILDRLAPTRDGMHIDLDDAGVRRHLDDVDARILRRRIALNMHRTIGGLRRQFDHGEQFEIILHALDRRHEGAQDAVARLDGERRAHGAGDGRFRRLLRQRRTGGRAIAVQDLFGIGQGAANFSWVLRRDVGIGVRRDVRQGAQRQAEADG